MATSELVKDGNWNRINGFSPDPATVVNTTIADGADTTVTVTGLLAMQFTVTQSTRVSLNSNSAYMTYGAGMYEIVLNGDITSIKFANASGSSCALEYCTM